MLLKKEPKRLRAEYLWNNICVYRKDSAKKISKDYDYNLDEIINMLETFPELKSYSGHQKGKKGDGENKSAMNVIEKAIQFLKNDKIKDFNDSNPSVC